MSSLPASTIGTFLAIAALGFVQPSVLRADAPEPFPIAGMPPLAPETRRETLQATDCTWHDCLVFTTVPGVLYTIQRSVDLNTWTDETTHYGLGHDFATALRAVDGPAAPAPPGGEPPPIPVPSLRLVSITLRPSAGVVGGTVVSWPSLHGGGPVSALIPENLDAAWGTMVLYVIGQDAGGSPVESRISPDDPAWIEEELDKIYGRQANLYFEVTIHREAGPDDGGIDFDTAGPTPHDGKILALPGDPEFVAATPNPQAAGENPPAHIDVWVVPGVRLISSDGKPKYGRSFIRSGRNGAIIDGDLLGKPLAGTAAKGLFIHILAHEIGHVFFGGGHPDTGDSNATLLWRNSQSGATTSSADPRDIQRLMYSATVRDANGGFACGRQLIYREWQLIEAWLKANRIGEPVE